MNASDDPSSPIPIQPELIPIPYASSPSPFVRRWPAYIILGIYLVLVAVMLTTPVLIAANNKDTPALGALAGGVVALMTVCGFTLLIVPVRIARRRPITRRSILIPIIASGLLLGGLIVGGGLALTEVFAPAINRASSSYSYVDHSPSDLSLWTVVASAIAVWIGWSLLFFFISRRRDPASLGMKLHRLLIVGSVLELLVAVPSHIIVRRRGDCCGGIMTGTGICIGVCVALVSFGPSVLLLYFRRCRQIRN